MNDTIISLDYTLPLGRVVRILRTSHEMPDGECEVRYTCTVSPGLTGRVMPGFTSIENCVRWAQNQLLEVIE